MRPERVRQRKTLPSPVRKVADDNCKRGDASASLCILKTPSRGPFENPQALEHRHTWKLVVRPQRGFKSMTLTAE